MRGADTFSAQKFIDHLHEMDVLTHVAEPRFKMRKGCNRVIARFGHSQGKRDLRCMALIVDQVFLADSLPCAPGCCSSGDAGSQRNAVEPSASSAAMVAITAR